MSRAATDHGEPGPEHEPGSGGRVQVTGPGPLVVLGLSGLVIGWSTRWIAIQSGSPAPRVGWTLVAIAWFLAVVTAGVAYLTRRALQNRPRTLTPQQGLNRLVLGKSIDRLAAFGLGSFLGIAISRLGAVSDSAEQVILRAVLAAVGAAGAVAAGLWLEHACRVPPGPRPDLP